MQSFVVAIHNCILLSGFTVRPLGGQRNWVQVVANGGVGTIACLLYLSQYGTAERPIDFILTPNPSKILVAIIGYVISIDSLAHSN